jgi:hypothetical protein
MASGNALRVLRTFVAGALGAGGTGPGAAVRTAFTIPPLSRSGRAGKAAYRRGSALRVRGAAHSDPPTRAYTDPRPATRRPRSDVQTPPAAETRLHASTD